MPGSYETDPWWPWLTLGGSLLALGVASLWSDRARALLKARPFAFPLALHMHWLVTQHPHDSVYLIGAASAVLMSALIIEQRSMLIAFTVWVLALLYGWDVRATIGGFYPAAILSGLLLAHVRNAASIAADRDAAVRMGELERRVAERTQTLQETAEHLKEETKRRRRLQEEVEVSHRMESAGRLAGGLAHEFNNQLMTIQLYLDLLKRDLPEGSEAAEDVDTASAATRRAAALTAQLLTIGRAARSGPPASIADVVRASSDLVHQLMGAHISVEIRIAPGDMTVPVDADRLQQILLNLVLNARDAMPETGTFAVTVDRFDGTLANLPRELRNHPEKLVRMSVADSGHGIDAHSRPRIFDPYFTTKNDPGRSGLGLAVVYSTVVESGGHVRVFSDIGEGTCFEIHWPPAERVDAVASVGETEGRRDGLRVLLVEDETEIRAGIVRFLTDAGFEIREAGDAEEAMRLVEAGVAFDVLASDVVLPGENGTALVERLRARSPGVRAVLFSGHRRSDEGTPEPLPKDVIFLQKPFSPSDLLDAIRKIVHGS